MSLKKELLNELTTEQLKKLAEDKKITFKINTIKRKYYQGWNEKDKLIDLMTEHSSLTITDIEVFINQGK